MMISAGTGAGIVREISGKDGRRGDRSKGRHRGGLQARLYKTAPSVPAMRETDRGETGSPLHRAVF